MSTSTETMSHLPTPETSTVVRSTLVSETRSNGHGSTETHATPSKKATQSRVADWWQLAQLVLDFPRSRLARFWLPRKLPRLSRFPMLHEKVKPIFMRAITCKDPETLLGDSLLDAQVAVLKFVILGRWNAKTIPPVRLDECKPADGVPVLLPDWDEKEDEMRMQFQVPESIRDEDLVPLLKKYITEERKKGQPFYVNDQENTYVDELDEKDDALPTKKKPRIVQGARRICWLYFKRLCKAIALGSEEQLPPYTSFQFPYEHPELGWSAMLKLFGIQLRLMRRRIKLRRISQVQADEEEAIQASEEALEKAIAMEVLGAEEEEEEHEDDEC